VTKQDETLYVGNSRLQFGPFNDRIYLYELDEADWPEVLSALDGLMQRVSVGKVVAKVPARCVAPLLDRGFELELGVPGLFREGGGERLDGVFAVRYLDAERRPSAHEREQVRQVLELVRTKAQRVPETGQRQVHELGPESAEELAAIYGEVFASYPFPIQDPAFLRSCMEEGVRYFGVYSDEGRLIAVSSAEPHSGGANVEMTDFATLPPARGQGLALELLNGMHRALLESPLRSALPYTIARALEVGMNLSFARAGYAMAGTLWRNTNIGGQLEQMNVWYRPQM
jgi:putative beta-lysine N-acetyltransferase